MNSPVSGMSNDALMQLVQQAKQQQQQQQAQAAQQQPHPSYEPYTPSPPSSPSPNMGLSAGAHGTDQLRDTVLYLVQQQKLRHEELVGVVKDLAHAVLSVSVDVQHIKHHGGGGGSQGGGSLHLKTGPQSLPPTHEDATAYQDGDVVGGEIGFAGSYAATQTLWAHTHGSPLAFQREEQLVSAMKRIEHLERETANLRLQVRTRDETIRRLTDAGLRGILNKGNYPSGTASSVIAAAGVGSCASPMTPNRSSVVDAYLADRWGTSSTVNDSHRMASPSTSASAQHQHLPESACYPAQGTIFNSPVSQSRGNLTTRTTPISSPYTPKK